MLLEMSVLGSWVIENDLAVQALAKKNRKRSGGTAKLSNTKAVNAV